MKLNTILLAGAAMIAATGASAQNYVVNTGAPTSDGPNYSLYSAQNLAGYFTLSKATDITSIEGYIDSFSDNSGTISLFSDGSTPNTANLLSTNSFKISGTGWQGIYDQNIKLAAGNYWVGFSTTGSNGMYGNAPSPLSEYAYTNSSGWHRYDNLDIGVRIAGTTGAVPEPATWAMMLLGFGMIGFGMRYRRKGTKVSFA